MLGPQSVGLSVCLAVGLVVFLWLARSLRSRSGRLPLPPGPPGLPLIGNVLDYPKVSPWLAFKDMGLKYGGVASLRIMGQQIIILNDSKAAIDLLEKRSSIYSSRPTSPIFKLTGWDWAMPFMPYDNWWRRHRRAFWQHFHPGTIHKYHAGQEESARVLLSRLLETPGDFAKHMEYAISIAVIGTCYGLPVVRENDPYINSFKVAKPTLDLVATGSNVLVQSFPVLARLPTWIPGTGFLRRLEHARAVTTAMREMPWSDVKEAIAAGDRKSGIAGKILQEVSSIADESTFESEEVVGKNIAAVVYFAGLDSIQSALYAFLVAMYLFPDVQTKAQAEIDCLLGQARHPTVADMDSLPYVSAIVKETLRWHVIGPLAFPHVTIADDEYNGYFIPKNSVVIPNSWAFLHDPEVYPDPDAFVPERFLKDGTHNAVLNPTTAFGYGRRVCPGRHYATTVMFIYMASILHTFNITPPLDEDGNPIRIKPRPTTGLISFLEDTRCTLSPRSAWAEALIRRESTDAVVSN